MRSLAELMNLKGRVAIITGGAGHIGGAMAEALTELECGVCLVDVSDEGLRVAAEGLRKTRKVPIETLRIDLESEDDRNRMPAAIEKTFGRLDILINNAALGGTSPLQGWVTPFGEQFVDTWRRALEVNVTAAFHLSQLFMPMLKASGNGVILNVGSTYGVSGPDFRLYEGTKMGNPAAYAASKAGIIQLSKYMATVLAPTVRVNSLSPGGVFRQQPDSFVERYIARTPMQRMAKEEDFKGAVAYLCSDASAYVTGHNLMVDGGWVAW
jgi:NAD(P)-dependent dehydrogenase (short-subunit alcohol dehydrogenase family)